MWPHEKNRIIGSQRRVIKNRNKRAVFTLIGICFLSLASSGSPLPGTESPASPAKASTQTAPVMPKPLWQSKLEVEETDFIEFLSNDRILVGTIDTTEMGGGLKPSEVKLLNSANGEPVWSSPRGSYGSPQTILEVYPVILLRGSKQIAALSPENGKELWAREKPDETSHLLPARDLIVFVSCIKEQPQSLYALNVKTGSEVWRTPLQNYPREKGVQIEVTAMGDDVLLSGPQVAAFSGPDGKLLWQTAFPGKFGPKAAAVPLGDGLYFADGGSITRAEPQSGKKLWSEDISDGTFEALTTSEHRLFVILRGGGQNPPDWIAAIDSGTGKQLWKSNLLERAASPISIEGNLLYLTTPRNVIALDASNGSVVFRSAIPIDLQSDRQLSDNLRIESDRIVVAREIGVLALRKADGKLLFWDVVRGGMGFTYDYATNRIRHVAVASMPRNKSKKKQQAPPNPDSAPFDENYRVEIAEQKAAYESMIASQAAYLASTGNTISSAYRQQITSTDNLFRHRLISIDQKIHQEKTAANMEFAAQTALGGMQAMAVVGSFINTTVGERVMASYQARVTQAIETHANSLQEKFYLRPAYEWHRGWSLHVVNLETGQRGDILLSSDDSAPDVEAPNLPTFSVNGSQIVSKGLGANPERAPTKRMHATLAGKVTLFAPSVLAFDAASLAFEPCSKEVTPTTQPVQPAKRGLDDQLIQAALLSDLETVRHSLDAGADVNAVDAYGKTALMLAAEAAFSYDKPDIIELLLARGADPLLRDPGGLRALDHLAGLATFQVDKGLLRARKLLMQSQKED